MTMTTKSTRGSKKPAAETTPAPAPVVTDTPAAPIADPIVATDPIPVPPIVEDPAPPAADTDAAAEPIDADDPAPIDEPEPEPETEPEPRQWVRMTQSMEGAISLARGQETNVFGVTEAERLRDAGQCIFIKDPEA